MIYSAPRTRRTQNCANSPAEIRNSETAGSLELGSRFEPARLRRPRLTPRPAPRARRKTTQYGKNGRAGERGGTPPPARLLRASTAALPGSPRSSFVPSGEPALSPLYPRVRSNTSEIANKGSRRRCGCRRGARPGSTWVFVLGAIGVGQKTRVEGFTRVRFSRPPYSPFCFLERWRFRPVSGANEARSDHDALTVPAIPCVKNML